MASGSRKSQSALFLKAQKDGDNAKNPSTSVKNASTSMKPPSTPAKNSAKTPAKTPSTLVNTPSAKTPPPSATDPPQSGRVLRSALKQNNQPSPKPQTPKPVPKTSKKSTVKNNQALPAQLLGIVLPPASYASHLYLTFPDVDLQVISKLRDTGRSNEAANGQESKTKASASQSSNVLGKSKAPSRTGLEPHGLPKPSSKSNVDTFTPKLNETAADEPSSDELEREDVVISSLSLRRKTRNAIQKSPSASQSDQDDHPRRSNNHFLRTQSAKHYDVMEIDDESSDESDSYSPRLLSDVAESRTLRKRKLHSKADRRDRHFSTSESDFAPVRRSHRARKDVNMKEYGEDDIPEAQSSSSTASRFVGQKEYFEALPARDVFRLRHCQVCDSCQKIGDRSATGPLIFCQGCSLSYHSNCLGYRYKRDHLVTKIGERNFVLQCRYCVGTAVSRDPLAPHHDMCQTCKLSGEACHAFRERKSSQEEHEERTANGGMDVVTQVDTALLNNAKLVLFRCTLCRRAYHFQHLPSLEDETDDEKTLGDKSLADVRFDQYKPDFICKECASAPAEVSSLVAWRPTDIEKYTPDFGGSEVAEDMKEYLVRWKKMSYFHTEWKPGAWVWGAVSASMRIAFARREDNILSKMTAEDAIPESYLRFDIIFDVEYTGGVRSREEKADKARIKDVSQVLVKFKGLGYEDTVWEKPPPKEESERWKDYQTAYNDWVKGHYIHCPQQHNLKRHLMKVRSLDFEKNLLRKKQPTLLTGGKLMEYQLEGLNWLYYQWFREKNAILADEMGLGKTIQVIAFLSILIGEHKCWPFLVVVPNSTCPNWRREIQKWAPSLKVVTYYGLQTSRKLAMDYELFLNKDRRDLRCHVVVTSYDTVTTDANGFFKNIPWVGLVVDEGQRLKNDKNLLYEALSHLAVPFKLLLTGTPLQNNARELFNLIQFLDTSQNAAALELEYAELTKDNVPQLHELIRPFFLRRTKAQVLTFLPPMAQIIIPVTMGVLQKKLYKSILAKNPDLLRSIFSHNSQSIKNTERHNLNNILMQLRKCLCHPFVYGRNIEERTDDMEISHRNLVEASPKLQLLEIMLPKLQDRGHRVLIFSQFLDMLDLVEDFLDGLGLKSTRLDGKVGSTQRQMRIDEFNAPDSKLFAFLLSTRAGGVGINLATADTVIIMDPDFNPHQDIQALSRAHRIGQKNKVLCFQLMTRDTVEEKIMQIGKKKMALDHVLIEKMDADEESGESIESILRHGADALFADENQASNIRYDSTSVDKLLDRSQIESSQTGKDDSEDSQFSFAKVWVNDKATLEDNLEESKAEKIHVDVWEKILAEREKAVAEENRVNLENFGRGKRKRQHVNYSTDSAISPKRRRQHAPGSDSDTDFEAPENSSGPEDKDDYVASDNDVEILELQDQPGTSRNELNGPFSRNVPHFVRATVPPNVGLPDNAQPDKKSDKPPCLACGEPHITGHCPLKLAGIEKCPLCGLAHYGVPGTCPNLRSEGQIKLMLQALDKSTESMDLVSAARNYLLGIYNHFLKIKEQAKEHVNAKNTAPANPIPVNGATPFNAPVPFNNPGPFNRPVSTNGAGPFNPTPFGGAVPNNGVIPFRRLAPFDAVPFSRPTPFSGAVPFNRSLPVHGNVPMVAQQSNGGAMAHFTEPPPTDGSAHSQSPQLPQSN